MKLDTQCSKTSGCTRLYASPDWLALLLTSVKACILAGIACTQLHIWHSCIESLDRLNHYPAAYAVSAYWL